MTQPDPVVAALVAAITPAVAEQYPQLATTNIVAADLVTAVLTLAAAANDVVSGDPVTMVRQQDDGTLARRVLQGGVPMWQINPADGSATYYDMAPTLTWTAIYTPET